MIGEGLKTAIVDATLFGLFLDQPADADPGSAQRVVHDLADAVERLST